MTLGTSLCLLRLNLIFSVSPETFEAREDQGLLADGGGVHQEPGETEAPGGEERGGEEQGIFASF